MENELTLTHKFFVSAADAAERTIDAAHLEWRQICREWADNPADLQRFFEANGIYVDYSTCRRWLNGESIPSFARLMEIEEAGATGVTDRLMKHARQRGDSATLRRDIHEMAQDIERRQRALAQKLAQLDRLDRAGANRTNRKSFAPNNDARRMDG